VTFSDRYLCSYSRRRQVFSGLYEHHWHLTECSTPLPAGHAATHTGIVNGFCPESQAPSPRPVTPDKAGDWLVLFVTRRSAETDQTHGWSVSRHADCLAAFSQDNTLVVSGVFHKTIHIWDTVLGDIVSGRGHLSSGLLRFRRVASRVQIRNIYVVGLPGRNPAD
jgi:hypothetical protein